MPKISKKSKSIDDIIVDYLEYCNYKNLSLKTIKYFHRTLMLFSKYLEEEKQIMDINKINKNIVEEYISFTKECGKYSFVASEEGMIKANIDKRSEISKKDRVVFYSIQMSKLLQRWLKFRDSM